MQEQNKREKRIREIEAQIADLKHRMPAHSVKPVMILRLEELEEELEQLKKERLVHNTAGVT